jgi:NADH-ubiquinone oxidoreductase chain 5
MLLLLAVAAITKRAQIPFRAWLPAAMAAPTPVSALVHSSTLVTAGIYVLIRLFNRLPKGISLVLSWFGAVTIILARFRALKETDGKKIIALSTLSQLGVMITGFRFDLPSLVFFHLLSHAFFKALLFISTGFVIHRFNNYQNLRLMGGRRK